MLCKTLHIENTAFRMLPNPTPYHWDTNFFNLRKLIAEYSYRIHKIKNVPELKELKSLATKLVKAIEVDKKFQEDEKNRLLREIEKIKEAKAKEARDKLEKERLEEEAAAKGASSATEVQEKNGFIAWPRLRLGRKGAGQEKDEESAGLPRPATARTPTPATTESTRSSWLRLSWPMPAGIGLGKPEPQAQSANGPKPDTRSKAGFSPTLLNTLHATLDTCDESIKAADRDLVRTVLREHFQEVLKMINGDDDDEPEPSKPPKKEDAKPKRRSAWDFDDVSAASPEDRQKLFMEIYFKDVLEEVKERAVRSFRKMTTFRHHAHGRTLTPTPSSMKSAYLAPPEREGSPGDISQAGSDIESDVGTPQRRQELSELETRAMVIWSCLMLRMLCWLLLHDFDRKDVQIPKSELLGSRLPVYIS